MIRHFFSWNLNSNFSRKIVFCCCTNPYLKQIIMKWKLTIETIRLSRIDACKTYLVPKQPEWARLDEGECSAYPWNYFYVFRTIWWMNLEVPPLINVAWNTQTHMWCKKNVVFFFCSKIWQEFYFFACKTFDKRSMELNDGSISAIEKKY